MNPALRRTGVGRGDGPESGTMKAGASRIGLCEHCRHAKRIETPRSVFWMCALAATDPRFAKYPRLPVIECAGFEPPRETDSGAG
jgi:hypothetical protein